MEIARLADQRQGCIRAIGRRARNERRAFDAAEVAGVAGSAATAAPQHNHDPEGAREPRRGAAVLATRRAHRAPATAVAGGRVDRRRRHVRHPAPRGRAAERRRRGRRGRSAARRLRAARRSACARRRLRRACVARRWLRRARVVRRRLRRAPSSSTRAVGRRGHDDLHLEIVVGRPALIGIAEPRDAVLDEVEDTRSTCPARRARAG